VYSNVIV